MNLTRRNLIAGLATVLVLGAGHAVARGGRGHGARDSERADEQEHEHKHSHDFEAAAAARQSGEVRPLQEILEEVDKLFPGEVVGVEFENKNGAWVYEVKKLSPRGSYLEIYVDARTKKILKVEGK